MENKEVKKSSAEEKVDALLKENTKKYAVILSMIVLATYVIYALTFTLFSITVSTSDPTVATYLSRIITVTRAVCVPVSFLLLMKHYKNINKVEFDAAFFTVVLVFIAYYL